MNERQQVNSCPAASQYGRYFFPTLHILLLFYYANRNKQIENVYLNLISSVQFLSLFLENCNNFLLFTLGGKEISAGIIYDNIIQLEV